MTKEIWLNLHKAHDNYMTVFSMDVIINKRIKDVGSKCLRMITSPGLSKGMVIVSCSLAISPP